MTATAAGMKDWRTHIKFMQFNAEHPQPRRSRAATTWEKQYEAHLRTSKRSRRQLRTSRHRTANRRRARGWSLSEPYVHVACMGSAWGACNVCGPSVINVNVSFERARS